MSYGNTHVHVYGMKHHCICIIYTNENPGSEPWSPKITIDCCGN